MHTSMKVMMNAIVNAKHTVLVFYVISVCDIFFILINIMRNGSDFSCVR